MPMTDEGCYCLCKAIIRRAVKDYRAVCRGKCKAKAVSGAEIEGFFHGRLFAAMCGSVNPETLLEKIRRSAHA